MIVLKDEIKTEFMNKMDSIQKLTQEGLAEVGKIENTFFLQKLSGRYACQVCQCNHAITGNCSSRHKRKARWLSNDYDREITVESNDTIPIWIHVSLYLPGLITTDTDLFEKEEETKKNIETLRDLTDLSNISEVFLSDLAKAKTAMKIAKEYMVKIKRLAEDIEDVRNLAITAFDYSNATKEDFKKAEDLRRIIQKELEEKFVDKNRYTVIEADDYGFWAWNAGKIYLVDMKQLKITRVKVELKGLPSEDLNWQV